MIVPASADVAFSPPSPLFWGPIAKSIRPTLTLTLHFQKGYFDELDDKN